jgi:hypothetical protein
MDNSVQSSRQKKNARRTTVPLTMEGMEGESPKFVMTQTGYTTDKLLSTNRLTTAGQMVSEASQVQKSIHFTILRFSIRFSTHKLSKQLVDNGATYRCASMSGGTSYDRAHKNII